MSKHWVATSGPLARHPAWFDVVLAVTLAGFCCGVTTGLAKGTDRPADVLMYVLINVCAIPLAWRRVDPLGSLALSVSGLAVYVALGYPGGPIFALPLVAVYCVGLLVDRPTLPTVLGVSSLVIMAAQYVGSRGDDVWQVFAFWPTWVFGATFVGLAGRNRRQQANDAAARLAESEAKHVESAQRQVAEERLRIARDIHDVVGHSLASIAVMAGAGSRVFDANPMAAKQALEDIRRASADALSDVRATIGDLRSGTMSSEPNLSDTGGDVEHLLDQFVAAGLVIDSRLSLDPATLADPERTVLYRVAQESLTNVLRHSGSKHASVSVAADGGGVTLSVRDFGRGVGDAQIDGHGVMGIRERTSALGGTVTMANHPDGGFVVDLWLPTLPVELSRAEQQA